MQQIELRGVNYAYDANEGPVAALRDISFSVGVSELVCVVGRSGCGKTTLLNILAGFLPPTKGDVLIAGRSVTGKGLDRGIVFQDFAQLFPWRTAQRNVEFGLEMKGVARGSARPRRNASCVSWGWKRSPARIRTSSRAACSSAWRSPARSHTTRRCC